MNKSSQFLLPLIDVEGPISNPEFVASYISSSVPQNESEYGEYLYVRFNKDVSETHLQKLKSSSNFSHTFTVPDADGDVVLAYKISEKDKVGVVIPFMSGAYSKMDIDYVDRAFPNDPSHKMYGNRMVIEKDPFWLDYWERKGVSIPSGQEVWSKPDLTAEVLWV